MFLKSFLLLNLFLSSAEGRETIVITGSDTLGAKMVPELKEKWLEEGNEGHFRENAFA